MPFYIIDPNTREVFGSEQDRPAEGAYSNFEVLFYGMGYPLGSILTQAQLDWLRAYNDKIKTVRQAAVSQLQSIAGLNVTDLTTAQLKILLFAVAYEVGLIDENAKVATNLREIFFNGMR